MKFAIAPFLLWRMWRRRVVRSTGSVAHISGSGGAGSACEATRVAEVGRNDLWVGLDLSWNALGDHSTEIEHEHAVGDAHHHRHVMLDQYLRDAKLLLDVEQDGREVLRLFEAHASHWLIEQQQPRLGGERT